MHLGIIPDGNRRFGKENFKDGHFEGMKNILKTILWFTENEDVNEMTIFCFSEENWKRSKDEIDYLMTLFEVILVELCHSLTKGVLSKEAQILISDSHDIPSSSPPHEIVRAAVTKINVNLAITNEEKIPQNIKDKIKELSRHSHVETTTSKKLNLCVSYTGRKEISLAVKRVIEAGEDVTVENIESKLLITSSPDLIIRTSGENRISGFLSWQSSYSEFMFLDKHWPEIETKDLEECILNFKKRERRFGK